MLPLLIIAGGQEEGGPAREGAPRPPQTRRGFGERLARPGELVGVVETAPLGMAEMPLDEVFETVGIGPGQRAIDGGDRVGGHAFLVEVQQGGTDRAGDGQGLTGLLRGPRLQPGPLGERGLGVLPRFLRELPDPLRHAGRIAGQRRRFQIPARLVPAGDDRGRPQAADTLTRLHIPRGALLQVQEACPGVHRLGGQEQPLESQSPVEVRLRQPRRGGDRLVRGLQRFDQRERLPFLVRSREMSRGKVRPDVAVAPAPACRRLEPFQGAGQVSGKPPEEGAVRVGSGSASRLGDLGETLQVQRQEPGREGGGRQGVSKATGQTGFRREGGEELDQVSPDRPGIGGRRKLEDVEPPDRPSEDKESHDQPRNQLLRLRGSVLLPGGRAGRSEDPRAHECPGGF